MIRRRHTGNGCTSEALYSPCQRYRYGLRRCWDRTGPVLLCVMLNPSTADERRNDPTIERCERRARSMGFGQLRIANLFAWRATQPRDLRRAELPVGPDNDRLLRRWHRASHMTLAAWGVHGRHMHRDAQVLAMLTGPLHHLGLTQAGHPRHPLYVPYDTHPEPWSRTP